LNIRCELNWKMWLVIGFGLFHILWPILQPDLIIDSQMPENLHKGIIVGMGILTLYAVHTGNIIARRVAAFLYLSSIFTEVTGQVTWNTPYGYTLNLVLAVLDLVTAYILWKEDNWR